MRLRVPAVLAALHASLPTVAKKAGDFQVQRVARRVVALQQAQDDLSSALLRTLTTFIAELRALEIQHAEDTSVLQSAILLGNEHHYYI